MTHDPEPPDPVAIPATVPTWVVWDDRTVESPQGVTINHVGRRQRVHAWTANGRPCVLGGRWGLYVVDATDDGWHLTEKHPPPVT